MMKSLPPKPQPGQTMEVRGVTCTVVKVLSYGSVLVRSPNGQHYNVSGLGWSTK